MMPTTPFNRGAYEQLWITLNSDEPLGVLDTDYLEDYFGNDGQITLHHVATVQDFQLAMLPVPSETPGVDNDVFRGVYSPLENLPDGEYELRFRCRDLFGNYTIANSVQNPVGDERILEIKLNLLDVMFGHVIVLPGVTIRLGLGIYAVREPALSINATRPSW